MKKTATIVAGALMAAAGIANAQCPTAGNDGLANGGFEAGTKTIFGTVDQTLPYGFTAYSGPSMVLRRYTSTTLTSGDGDGETPALFPVGTPGQLTPHSGRGVLQLGRRNATVGFQSFPPGVYGGVSTDVRYTFGCPSIPPDPPNPLEDPAYCHPDFFDVNYNWDDNGDVVVSCWYMIPTDYPVTGAAGQGNGAGSIKVMVKTVCQNVATLDGNFDPASSESMHGTTNGQWVQFKRVFKNRDIRWEWYRNVYGTGPTDCSGGTGAGCACVPATPVPTRVKIEPARWSGLGASSGIIFIDDLDVMMVCKADIDDGDASGNPDGGVDINDLVYFLALFEAGDTAADLTGLTTPTGDDLPGFPDCGVDINDLLFFLTHFEAGC